MSALDQAFIKAYMQQEAVAAAWQRDDASVPEEPHYEQVEETATAVLDGPFTEFVPMLQVDRLAWPAAATKMGTAAGAALDQVIDHLIHGIERGQKVIALQGLRRGDGCTTLLLALGRRLAQRGVETVLFDADTDNPRLARRLGLAPEAGWEAAAVGRLPLADVVVQSLEDRLAILPFCEPSPDEERLLASQAALGAILAPLRDRYDVVLVDLGRPEKRSRINPSSAETVGSWLDAAILVQNVRTTPAGEVAQTCQRLQEAGVADVTVVENFTAHV